MTEEDAKQLAIRFMECQSGISPWSYKETMYIGPSDIFKERRTWTVIFNNDDPEFHGQICFHVVVDDVTGATSFLETYIQQLVETNIQPCDSHDETAPLPADFWESVLGDQ